MATDNSCVYVNEGSPKNREITMHAVHKGGPLSGLLNITIEQWKMTPTSLLPNMPVLLNTTTSNRPKKWRICF